jgi:hypothetical protein
MFNCPSSAPDNDGEMRAARRWTQGAPQRCTRILETSTIPVASHGMLLQASGGDIFSPMPSPTWRNEIVPPEAKAPLVS